MSQVLSCLKVSALSAAVFMLMSQRANATSGAWEGDTSLFWTNNNNWASNAAYPKGGETATFNSGGNNRTNINLQGVPSIKYITFDSYNAASYIFGTTPVGSQTLILTNDATIKLNPNVIKSQSFFSHLQLNTDRSAGTYYFQND